MRRKRLHQEIEENKISTTIIEGAPEKKINVNNLVQKNLDVKQNYAENKDNSKVSNVESNYLNIDRNKNLK